LILTAILFEFLLPKAGGSTQGTQHCVHNAVCPKNCLSCTLQSGTPWCNPILRR